MRRIWGVVGAVGLVVLAACGGSHREAKPAPPRLGVWDLAPPDSVLAIAARYADWSELPMRAEAAIKDAPGSDSQRGFLARMLSYPHVNMRSRAARRASGIDDDGPRVEYWTPRGRLWVYRVLDRAAYDRTFLVVRDRPSRGRLTVDRDGDTCAQLAGYQLCGTRAVLLDVLDGKRRSIAWPAGAAPTVRVWAAPSWLGGLAGATTGGDGLRVDIDIGRGELHARAHLSGTPGGLLAAFGAAGGSPLARRLPAGELSGAAVLNLTGWFQRTREQMIGSAGDARITSRVSKADLIAALRGDAVAWAVRGDRSGGIAVGFDKIEVARRLVADCEELGDHIPGARIGREGASCRIRHDALAELGGGDLVLRVRDDALVVELTRTGAAAAAAPAARPSGRRDGGAMLERVRTGDDGLAMWGAGLFAPLARANLAKQTIEADPFYLWLFFQVTETGGALRVDPDGIRAELAIRTAAHYDEKVQAALAPLLVRVARREEVAADAFGHLAAAHPGSELAADLSQGSAGPAVPLVAGAFVGAAAVELGRQLSAMAKAGEVVVSAYQDAVDAACRCKDRECGERAAARLQAWEERHGETVVDALSLTRIGELSREAEACLAPFFPEEEEGGAGGE